ncbi:MAG: flagellin lysine-N-methylase [Eubacteriales bacterium]|nr:flagellin lysine-N-methylase [Eubacteriales bacterium]
MGYFRYPLYYKAFRCIASACRDSCCIGWEIDIDANTLQYYQQIDDAFGRRLAENIALPPEHSHVSAHFITDGKERCPFLNSCNLCDIYIALGEQHLCQICTDHPRFYNWFTDGTEAGLGLCCEAAAELILTSSGYPVLESVVDDSQPEVCFDAQNHLERDTEQLLFSMREELFHIIKPESKQPLDKMMDCLFRAALSMQDTYDALLFPGMQAAFTDVSDIARISWSKSFWNPTFLHPLLDFYLTLEINDTTWQSTLLHIKENIIDILANRQAFLSWYQSQLYEYEQLLVYFLYRHFMKAQEDDALLQKVTFALISTCIIQLVDIWFWQKEHTLSHVQQIDICKLYSKEIEYDEDNTEKISFYPLPFS